MRQIETKNPIRFFLLVFLAYFVSFSLITIISYPRAILGEHAFLDDGGDSLSFARSKKYSASLWYKGEIPLWDPNTLCGVPILGNHIYSALSPLVFLLKLPGVPEGVTYTLAVIIVFSFGSGFIYLYVTQILECSPMLGFVMGILYNIAPSTEFFARYLSYSSTAFIPAILYFSDSPRGMVSWRKNIIVAVLLALSSYFGSIDIFLTNCFLVACIFGYHAVKNRSYAPYFLRLAAIYLLTIALSAAPLAPVIEILFQTFPRTISLLSSDAAINPLNWMLDSITPPLIWIYNQLFLYKFFKMFLGLTSKPVIFNGFRFLGPLSLFGFIYAFISHNKKTEFSRDLYLGITAFFTIFIWLLYDTGLPEQYMVAKRFPYLRNFMFLLLPLYIFMCASLFKDIITNVIEDRNRNILGKITILSGFLSICSFILITLAMHNMGPTFLKESLIGQHYSRVRINFIHVISGFGLIFSSYFLFYKILRDKKPYSPGKELKIISIICLCLFLTISYGYIDKVITYIRHPDNSVTFKKDPYEPTTKITPAESFVKNAIDPARERAEYQKGVMNFLRQLLIDVPIAGGYAAFYNKRLRDFFMGIDAYFQVKGHRGLMFAIRDTESPVTNLLAVKYFICEEKTDPGKYWELVYEDNSPSDSYRYVYKNRKAAQRFFTVSSMKTFDDKDSLLAAINKDKNLLGSAYILKEDLDSNALDFLKGLKSHNDQSDNKIRISSYKSASITLETENREAKILIIATSWDPGWSCKIDGNTSPIYPFYYALQGILLPPGKHNIELAYSPESFKISAIVSLISWAGVIFYLVFDKRRPERTL